MSISLVNIDRLVKLFAESKMELAVRYFANKYGFSSNLKYQLFIIHPNRESVTITYIEKSTHDPETVNIYFELKEVEDFINSQNINLL